MHARAVACLSHVSTPIIAFAKDWHEDPTSNHHVLRELARSRRVVWLNSIATRTPKLSSGRDLGKIARKLRELATRPDQRRERSVGVHAARVAVPAQRGRARDQPPDLARDDPHAAAAARTSIASSCGRSCRTSATTSARSARTARSTTASTSGRCSATSIASRPSPPSATLLEKVDAVFAINEPLADAKRAVNAQTFVSPHGVDHAAFARALDPALAEPRRPRRAPAPAPRLLRHAARLGRLRAARARRARAAALARSR